MPNKNDQSTSNIESDIMKARHVITDVASETLVYSIALNHAGNNSDIDELVEISFSAAAELEECHAKLLEVENLLAEIE